MHVIHVCGSQESLCFFFFLFHLTRLTPCCSFSFHTILFCNPLVQNVAHIICSGCKEGILQNISLKICKFQIFNLKKGLKLRIFQKFHVLDFYPFASYLLFYLFVTSYMEGLNCMMIFIRWVPALLLLLFRDDCYHRHEQGFKCTRCGKREDFCEGGKRKQLK